jgi:hypothetical protein
MPDTNSAVAKKTKAPLARGFNRGLLRGLGLREAHCHRNNVGATTPFPFENRTSESAGRSRHPSALAPHSASPGPHRQIHIIGKQDGGKGDLQD